MKKLIIFFIGLFVLCGCSAQYEVSVNGPNVKEKLTLLEYDKSKFDIQDESGWTLRESFEALLTKDEFSKEDYSVKSLSDDNKLGVEYNKSMLLDDIKGLSILNQCYTNYSITISDDIISIDTGNNFNCFDYYDNLDTVKFIFTTNHKVISTNSIEQDGNSYIWNLTRGGDNHIMIEFSESDYTNYFKYLYIIIPSFIIIVGGIIIYYVSFKKKKENKI